MSGYHSSRWFFLGLGVLCLVVAGISLADIVPRVVADTRIARHGIPAMGIVVDTRLARDPFLQKEGLVEFIIDGQVRRQWLVMERYYKQPPKPGGVGKSLAILYDPVIEAARNEPPDPVGGLLGLPPFLFLAALGLFLAIAMMRLLLKGEPYRTGPPYPNLTRLARTAMLIIGGAGVLGILVLLDAVFMFAAQHPSTPTLAGRWHAIEVAVGAHCGAAVLTFALMTGLVVLCMKAVGRHAQMASNTGRHLLFSLGLATILTSVELVLVVIGFGLP